MSSQPQKTEASPKSAAVRPGLSAPWIAAYVGVGLLVLIISLRITAANAATDLADAGALVRWGLPITEVVHNFAMATTMGALIFAMGIIPRYAADAAGTRHGTRSAHNTAEKEYKPFADVLNLAAASAVLWTLAALAVLILSYADISGRPIGSGAEYASELISYVTTLDAGKEKGMTVVVAAVVATACFGVRSLMGLFFIFMISLVGIADMALSGHSSGGQDHMGAVNSLGLHLLGAQWWWGLVAGVLVAFVGTMGDLTESLIKREAGLKDMSQILPGHGGVLDRVDALLMSAPVAYFIFAWALPGISWESSH